MPVNPNPQGKGLVPVLQGLDSHRLSRLLPAKPIDQIQRELFTSLFVLQSDIRFNPVPGRSYWLYQCEGRFRLLLVGPTEWSSGFRGRFIGECILQSDRTWTLMLDAFMAQDQAFMQQIDRERNRLQQSLEAADAVEDILPVYEAGLTFYARILAFTLGKSLRASMASAGIEGLSYSAARGLLTRQ
ncbi:MAG: DUF2452 domain-containing protein [Pseudomonadales bacterium]|nr:DUF2452 domain-containing protein [Pseudomonadales bacterium]